MTESVEEGRAPPRERPDKLRKSIKAAEDKLLSEIEEALRRFAARGADIATMRRKLEEIEGRRTAKKVDRSVAIAEAALKGLRGPELEQAMQRLQQIRGGEEAKAGAREPDREPDTVVGEIAPFVPASPSTDASGGEVPTQPAPDLDVSEEIGQEATASARDVSPSDPAQPSAGVAPQGEAAAAPAVPIEPAPEPVATLEPSEEPPPQVDEEADWREAVARNPLIVGYASLAAEMAAYRDMLKELPGPPARWALAAWEDELQMIVGLQRLNVTLLGRGDQPMPLTGRDLIRMLGATDVPTESRAAEARNRIMSLIETIKALQSM